MDRNQIIGFSLIGVLFLVYAMFFQPEPVVENALINADTIQTVVKNQEASTADSLGNAAKVDTVVNQAMVAKYGIFAAAAVGVENELTLENKNIRVAFSTKGGKVKSVLLKNYLTYDKKPLFLLNEASNEMAMMVSTADNRVINISELYFTPEQKGNSIVYRLPVGEGKFVEQSYKLAEDGYQLDYDIKFIGLANDVKLAPLVINWKNKLQKIELDVNQSRDRSTVNYYTVDEGFDYITEASRSEESEKLETPVRWVNMKQKFFNAALIAKNNFSKATVSTRVVGEDTMNIKELEASLELPAADLINGKANLQFFFGPNKFKDCKGVAEGFEENVNFGWPVIKWLNRFIVLPVFQLLESFIGNYGIIIIILVILLKLVLLPLSYKSYISMAKMRVMKPELDEIKARVGDDMQKVQAEQMQLYQKVGINPLSGCIPVLLQMPILFAMFSFFPNAIELRQEAFLWSNDLSTYDAVLTWSEPFLLFGWNVLDNHLSLFTLLMTISTLVYTWFNNQMSSATMQGPMVAISYTMPVIFLFVLNSFPAGLSFYYFVSNIVTILQQVIIKRFVDEDALRAKLDENKKNYQAGNAKQSPFMKRLNDAMKAQEELKKKGKN